MVLSLKGGFVNFKGSSKISPNLGLKVRICAPGSWKSGKKCAPYRTLAIPFLMTC